MTRDLGGHSHCSSASSAQQTRMLQRNSAFDAWLTHNPTHCLGQPSKVICEHARGTPAERLRLTSDAGCTDMQARQLRLAAGQGTDQRQQRRSRAGSHHVWQKASIKGRLLLCPAC